MDQEQRAEVVELFKDMAKEVSAPAAARIAEPSAPAAATIVVGSTVLVIDPAKMDLVALLRALR